MPVQAKQPTYAKSYAEDRAEIEDLMARYTCSRSTTSTGIPTSRPLRLDGELEFASGTSKGRDAIRAAVTSFSKRIGEFYHTEDGKPAILRHVVLQSSIRVEGNRAWGPHAVGGDGQPFGPKDTMKMGTYGHL